jgi:nucleoside-diphosphate-sugar epimerase
MLRVLVTGAGGYIGTTLVPLLLERGHSVRAIDRMFFGDDLLPTNPNLETIREDSRRLSERHLEGIDAVIDLVAISNDPSGELFQKATWEINHESRVRTANMAKAAGVSRYVLPSSCSIYGFQEEGVVCTEENDINPLTTYAKANGKAEDGVLPLADDNFTVVVLRQSTVFGYSPRMRFDLAINGMAYGAWKTGKLPLLRDGTQWRPMVHVRDTAAAQVFMLEYEDASRISGQIFNVGSDENNFQLLPLAELVAKAVPRDVEIEWYGDPDHRSYQVNCDKIKSLGWSVQQNTEEAVLEVCNLLRDEKIDKTDRTITLKWYENLVEWSKVVRSTELHGGMLDI